MFLIGFLANRLPSSAEAMEALNPPVNVTASDRRRVLEWASRLRLLADAMEKAMG